MSRLEPEWEAYLVFAPSFTGNIPVLKSSLPGYLTYRAGARPDVPVGISGSGTQYCQ